MHREVIEVEWTAEERSLILRHGYSFRQIQAALEACQASATIESLPLDVFEPEAIDRRPVPLDQRHEAQRRAKQAACLV